MFEITEILALSYLIAIHELGHAVAASLFNKKIEYALSPNHNPAIKIFGEMDDREYFCIGASGFLFTLFSLKIVLSLFNDVVLVLIFCLVISFGDFHAIYKRLIRKEGDTEDAVD